jgi:hypothetical protein
MENNLISMRYDDLTNFNYTENKHQIFDTIVSHIDLAIKKKHAQIYIKKLKIVDDVLDVTAEKADWPDCLTKALTFYKEIEDYESCSKCQKLIDKLESSNKKPKANARKTS